MHVLIPHLLIYNSLYGVCSSDEGICMHIHRPQPKSRLKITSYDKCKKQHINYRTTKSIVCIVD